VHRLEPAQRARRGNRLIADIVEPAFDEEAEAVARFAFEQLGPHVGPRVARRGRVEIEILVRIAARHVHGSGAESGNAAH